MAYIAAMRLRLAAAILGLVSACGGMAVADDEPVPLPRPRPPIWAEPRSFLEAAGPDFNTKDVTAEPSECRKRLDVIAVINAMPRLIGPGTCGGGDMVQLNAVKLAGDKRIVVKPAPVIRCEMAESLTAWIRDEAVPRVTKADKVLRSVDTYDDFNCRGRNRIIGAKMSEHGRGNAVDIRSFTFADNQVMELTDIKAPKDLRSGLRESVCARFMTVLGPGSDGYHEGHIHLDLAPRSNGMRICQWVVREPPPPPPPLKTEPEDPDAVVALIDGKPVPLPLPRPVIPAAQRL